MRDNVTVKDIAERAEVSIGTVSRVFNNHSTVKDELRKRVLQAAAEMGYQGAAGQNLYANAETPTQSVKEVGFFFSHFYEKSQTTETFWSRILAGVEDEARKSNITVTYQTLTKEQLNSKVFLNTLYEKRLGGILLVGAPDAETIEKIRSTNIPLVLVDNFMPSLKVDAVLSDNFQGTRQAVKYLLVEGHQQIAFVGGPPPAAPQISNRMYTIEQRLLGYYSALFEERLPLNYDLYVPAELTSAGGYEGCKELLARQVKFSAILCGNDPAAIGVMRALQEANYKIPQDVSVIGFDDIDIAAHLSPPLTTIRVDKEAMGATALRTLLAHARDPQSVSLTVSIGVELIMRASVAAARSQV